VLVTGHASTPDGAFLRIGIGALSTVFE